jgi:hypothetical protein
MKMKWMILCTLLFCVTAYVGAMGEVTDDESSSSSEAEKSDEVAVAIFQEGDKKGRIMKINDLISTVDPSGTLSREQKGGLRRRLKRLDVEDFNTKIAMLIKRRGGKEEESEEGEEKEGSLIEVLFAIVNQLEEQNKNMESSSELAQEVHRFNIRNYRLGSAAAVCTAIVSIGFNIWQATQEEECP